MYYFDIFKFILAKFAKFREDTILSELYENFGRKIVNLFTTTEKIGNQKIANSDVFFFEILRSERFKNM